MKKHIHAKSRLSIFQVVFLRPREISNLWMTAMKEFFLCSKRSVRHARELPARMAPGMSLNHPHRPFLHRHNTPQPFRAHDARYAC